MAGSFPGFAGCCQIDSNSKALAGALLYVFAGGTTNYSLTYQDIGLALSAPNPLVADGAGRVPYFFVADGTYHIRLTDADGVVQFENTSVPSIGASISGGGGSAVDPNTVFSTGDMKFRPVNDVLAGWVRCNGRTIGSATSGGTERANADTSALFTYLYTAFSDTKCPVSGGRGASASADFAANKTITLLDFRDRTPVGLDSMGAAAKGGLLAANILSGGGDTVDTGAATGGEANHVLTLAESAAHDHGGLTGAHSHRFTYRNTGISVASPGANPATDFITTSSMPTNVDTQTTQATIASAGSGTTHNTMQPFMLGTFYMKL